VALELFNWLLRRQAHKVREDKAIIVPLYRVATGEYQPESIKSAIDAYIHDTDIFDAINFISNAALSQGFYVAGDEEYWNGKVVDLVEEFNRSIRWGNRRGERGLGELLRIVTKELLYGGNTFVEMLTPNNLQMLNQVELSSIYKIYRNEAGDISKIQQLIGGKLNDLDPDSIIHIPWLQIDREPFGRGLIQPLIAPRIDVKGRQIPPLYKIKASLEYDIYRMIHRRGVPRSVFSFPEASDEIIQSYSQELKDPDVDASFATNTQVAIASEGSGPAQGLQNLILHLDKRFQAGLQTPINNLLNSSGYTEASARVAEELGMLIVKDLQMRLKHAIENELYERIILQAGLDPKKAKIELHWGARQEPEYTLTDLVNVFDRKLITVGEARKILRKVGWELEDDSALIARQTEEIPTVTTARGQQVALYGQQLPPSSSSQQLPQTVPTSSGAQQQEEPLIQGQLSPQQQAKAQGLGPGQTAPVDPQVA
jgi:hypothetical protein